MIDVRARAKSGRLPFGEMPVAARSSCVSLLKLVLIAQRRLAFFVSALVGAEAFFASVSLTASSRRCTTTQVVGLTQSAAPSGLPVTFMGEVKEPQQPKLCSSQTPRAQSRLRSACETLQSKVFLIRQHVEMVHQSVRATTVGCTDATRSPSPCGSGSGSGGRRGRSGFRHGSRHGSRRCREAAVITVRHFQPRACHSRFPQFVTETTTLLIRRVPRVCSGR